MRNEDLIGINAAIVGNITISDDVLIAFNSYVTMMYRAILSLWLSIIWKILRNDILIFLNLHDFLFKLISMHMI